MCGIIVCNYGDNRLASAESLIMHRGTDDHARIEKDNIIFSHFLHSVVGNKVRQPFVGKGTLIANCEIYNWRQLAETHGVTGKNDAEVLFGILEQSDNSEQTILDIIGRLDGDFACVYYRDNQLVMFRDPLGVNPLFFSLEPFFIASERKANPQILRELHPRTILFYNTKTKIAKACYSNLLHPQKQESTYEETKNLLFAAVDKRLAEVNSGILFSGGVDSIFLALRLSEKGARLTLYTAYADKNPEDIKYAREFARMFGFDHIEVEITEEALSSELFHICNAIDSSDLVKVGVAIPLYFAAKRASKEKIKVLYSGLGADDIFAGYARFRANASLSGTTSATITPNIHGEQLSSLRSIYERDLYRDNCIAMHNSIELRVPFLDISLVQSSLSLPEPLLVNKAILRRILKEHYKLDEKFWNRPKKAVQYGTKSMVLLRRLAAKRKTNTNSLLSQHYPMKIPLAALYTGGKDSAYAIYLMKLRNYEPRCLITIKSANKDSYMYHTSQIDAVVGHARKMGLPLIFQKTSGEKEKELEDLEKAISKAIATYGVEGIITGALYSDYQRTRIEAIGDKLGVRIFSPLWRMDQEMHMRRLIRDGFKFIFTSVAAEGLDKSWLNREITEKDVDALVKLNKKYGINIAGEGGEFESLVIDCPLFIKGVGK